MSEHRKSKKDGDRWLALGVGNSRLHWALFERQQLCYTWDTPHLSEGAIAHLTQSGFMEQPIFSADLIQSWTHLPPHSAPHVDWHASRSTVELAGDRSVASFVESFIDPLNHCLIHARRDSHLDSPSQPEDLITSALSFTQPPPLWVASVVPAQGQGWLAYPQAHALTLAEIPLRGLYPTLGIDRALALWGAAQWGAPTLVVDAGTALTITAADEALQLLGGCIVPGLRLQVRSLTQGTAALPDLTGAEFTPQVPLWAMDTPTAILSGVLQGAIALIQHQAHQWRTRYSTGAIALTGGDSALLYHTLTQQVPALAATIVHDSALLFRGLPALRQSANR